jgi:hypothetical protein
MCMHEGVARAKPHCCSHENLLADKKRIVLALACIGSTWPVRSSIFVNVRLFVGLFGLACRRRCSCCCPAPWSRQVYLSFLRSVGRSTLPTSPSFSFFVVRRLALGITAAAAVGVGGVVWFCLVTCCLCLVPSLEKVGISFILRQAYCPSVHFGDVVDHQRASPAGFNISGLITTHCKQGYT